MSVSLWIERRAPDTFLFASLLALTTYAAWSSIRLPYFSTADADVIFAYQAILINQGMSQSSYDHTGYVYIVVLANWYKLLHFLGILAEYRLNDFFRLKADQLERAYATLIYAGRALSIVLSVTCVLVLRSLIRSLTGSSWAASAIAGAGAVGPAIATHALQMRTELLAATFAVAAFAALTRASRAVFRRDAVRLLFFAGFMAALAVLTKLQVVILLLGYPLLIWPFAQRAPGLFRERSEPADMNATVVAIFFFAFSLPMIAMVITDIWIWGLGGVGGRGSYQLAIAGYLFGITGAFAFHRKIRLSHWLEGNLALLCGFSVGLYTIFAFQGAQNSAYLFNFLEHMALYADLGTGVGLGASSLMTKVVSNADHLLPFVFKFQGGAPVMLQFDVLKLGALIVPLFALAKRNWVLLWQSVFLCGFAIAVELIFALRAVYIHYLIFLIPWYMAVLALGLVYARTQISIRKAACEVIVPGIVAVSGLCSVLAPQFQPSQTREDACHQARGFLHRLETYQTYLCN